MKLTYKLVISVFGMIKTLCSLNEFHKTQVFLDLWVMPVLYIVSVIWCLETLFSLHPRLESRASLGGCLGARAGCPLLLLSAGWRMKQRPLVFLARAGGEWH